MAVLRERPYVQFNFLVDLGTGNTDGPEAGFQEVSGIGMEVTVSEYRTGNARENSVMKITGKYVAFSEDKRFIQADEQVKVRFRGVEVEANSVQVDLNADTLKALGKVHVSSDDQTMVGERLWLNLKTFESERTRSA